MTTNQPTPLDLLEAVREFMEKRVMPRVDEHTAYHTKVAVNALKIVERALTLAPDLEAAERQRLGRLLNRNGDLDELNRELCRQIRERQIDWRNRELLDHLRQTAMGKLTIDNPDYSACESAE
jgi:hypothetical protein